MTNEQIQKLINDLDILANEAGDGFDDRANYHEKIGALIASGVHPAKAAEWAREADKRDAILDRAIEKAERKLAKGHHVPFRRIIKTMTRFGREYQYHATKGWRSYRIAV